jgi:isoleucyl-tRNA synthetase
VALDLELDDELRREGLARELVRVIQDARKRAGLDVADRIELWVDAGEAVGAALEAHGDYIASETLAASVTAGRADDGADVATSDAAIEGEPVVVALRRSAGSA